MNSEASSPPIFHVVLVEPQIPQNTGNIGRTCLGTGCRLHLVRPLGFSLSEKAVRRAGLDYWKKVDLRVHESLPLALRSFAPERLVFTSAREGRAYTDHAFVPGQVIVFGREADGLPEAIRSRHATQLIRIPLRGPIRSLNLANAVSVILFEGLRQLDMLH